MKYCLLVIFLFAGLKPQEETFKVCFVKEEGQVLFAASNKPVKVTDMVRLSDRMLFKSKTAKLVIMNAHQGSLDVTWRGIVHGSSRIAELRELAFPPTKLVNFDSRKTVFEGFDPTLYFNAPETNNKVLLVEGRAVTILPSYIMDGNNFFFIQYSIDGKPLTKKIRREGQQLFFDRDTFPIVDGKIAPYDYTFCYQSLDKGQRSSEVIAHFIPVMVAAGLIRTQLAIIDSCFSSIPAKQKDNIILNYFYQNYGKVGLEALPITQ